MRREFSSANKLFYATLSISEQTASKVEYLLSAAVQSVLEATVEALQLCCPGNCLEELRGELIYLAPLGSENISAPYFKQCFFRGGRYYPPPRMSQTPRLPVPRQI